MEEHTPNHVYSRYLYVVGQISIQKDLAYLSCIFPQATMLHLSVLSETSQPIFEFAYRLEAYGDALTFDCSTFEPGLYKVLLNVDGHTFERELTIEKKRSLWQRLFKLK